MTVCARPRTFQPAKGQLRLLERNWLGSIVHSAAGSMIVTSATAPGCSVPRSMPRTRAGLIVSFSMSCGQVRWPGSIRATYADRQQRLQADDAVGRLVQLAHLLFRRVRRMVGGDDVQGAVLEAGDDGLHVGVGAQRRRHLVVAVEGAQALVGEREVVRTGLAGDADAALSGPADQVDAAGRGDVQDVQPAAGQLGQGDVAVDHHLLGRGRHAAQAQPHALEALVHDAAARQLEVLGSG